MDALEASLRSFSERNHRTRAAFQKMTARVNEISLTGTLEDLDEFNRSLGEQLQDILGTQGQDPATGGADGSGAHAGDGSGEQA